VVTKKFRCDLCNSVFKHCRQNIYAHMKDVHKISLQEYEDRAGISEVDDQQQVDEQQQDDMWPVGQDDEADVAAGPSLSDWLHVGHIPSRWNRYYFA
jgi:phage baseplate assembly protein W